MKIFVFPKDSNPYQSLLYDSIENQYGGNIQIRYCNRYPYIGLLHFPFTAAYSRLQGYKIIHIHWVTFNINAPFIPFKKQSSTIFSWVCIVWLKILQYRIVWTVHNVLPHESITSNDEKLMKYLSQVADAKIVHSKYTITQMQELNFDTKNSNVIPIGSYSNIYPDNINQRDAREALKISNDDFVLLFFGLVRSYKGIDDLLNVLAEINNPQLRLIVAGDCIDPALAKRIKLASNHLGVDFYNTHIPDDDVATFFKASDIVCLPFKKITTSSSALLAMSFGKPVIAPRMGSLTDFPAETGIFYDPAESDGLKKSLISIFANKSILAKMGVCAYEYSATLSWDKIAIKTLKLYEKVLLDRPNKYK